MSIDVKKTILSSSHRRFLFQSRVDYCNSIYFDSNDIVIKQLQSVLNASARLVTGLRRFDHITPSLKSLHWLPVRQRIAYKLATMVYGCLHERLPKYLKDACILMALHCGRAHLRSAQKGDLQIPRTKTSRMGQRSFRVSGPTI